MPRWLEEGRAWAERELSAALPPEDEPPPRLHAAMRYALLGGGKRLRPALVRLLCLELGGREAAARAPAVALELVHTYSLVDDALLTLAFEVLGEDERGREHARVLARAAGSRGMVGGQVLDLTLAPDEGALAPAALEDVHARKTAALFAAAAEMAAIAAGCGAVVRAGAAEFGRALGGLFQAVDDLLDVTGDAATLGKTPGKDAALARPTLVRALGLEGARRRAAELAATARARALALGFVPGAPVVELVEFVHSRRA